MKKLLTEKNFILVIVVAAVLVRLLYLPVPFIINVADGAGYVTMADLALKGNWESFLDDHINRTPMYPFFIALTKIVFGKFWIFGLSFLQHSLGVVMAVLVYLIGKRAFDSKAVGFLAGLLAAANAYQVYWEHNSMSDFLFTFVTVLTFYFLLKALTATGKRYYAILGVIFGLNLLVRPLFQVFILVIPPLIYILSPYRSFGDRIKDTFKNFALVLLPTLLIIAPWLFIHWRRHNFIGFTPFLGVQLMVRTQNYMDLKSPLRAKEKEIYLQTMREVGQCDEATIAAGRCGQVGVAGWADLRRKLGHSAVEANRALTEIGLEAIRKKPIRYLKETIEQVQILLTKHSRINFFGDLDLEPRFREQYTQRLRLNDRLTVFHQEIIWKLTFVPFYLFGLALVGMSLALVEKNLKSLPLTLSVIYIIAVTCAIEEGGATRYRIPVDPFLFIFTAYVLVYVFSHAKSFVYQLLGRSSN